MDASMEVRALILRHASTDLIHASARRAGMTSLADDGCRLVREGMTTIDEVMSVTRANDSAPLAVSSETAAADGASLPATPARSTLD
jgi:hypothetical protein